MPTIGDTARMLRRHGPDVARPELLAMLQDAIVAERRRADAPWRAQEHSYANLLAWDRLMSERPGPAKRQRREWNTRLGRTSHSASAPAVLTRNVGPRDGNGVRLWSGHTIHW